MRGGIQKGASTYLALGCGLFSGGREPLGFSDVVVELHESVLQPSCIPSHVAAAGLARKRVQLVRAVNIAPTKHAASRNRVPRHSSYDELRAVRIKFETVEFIVTSPRCQRHVRYTNRSRWPWLALYRAPGESSFIFDSTASRSAAH